MIDVCIYIYSHHEHYMWESLVSINHQRGVSQMVVSHHPWEITTVSSTPISDSVRFMFDSDTSDHIVVSILCYYTATSYCDIIIIITKGV